jgi:hypothetical protein
MVEVFKTNIQTIDDSKSVLGILSKRFPELNVNFDLDDCDNILRVEGENLIVGQIPQLVNMSGFQCEVLPD